MTSRFSLAIDQITVMGIGMNSYKFDQWIDCLFKTTSDVVTAGLAVTTFSLFYIPEF
jgi:hypothetical protein